MKCANKYLFFGVLFFMTCFLGWFTRQIESFKDQTTIVSTMNATSGFYSMLFFNLNHYLYCKRNQINFQLNTSNWLFKSHHGWTDYFLPIELVYNNNTLPPCEKSHGDVLADYNIHDYKEAIDDVYKYNERTLKNIDNIRQQLGLPHEYDAIFIRRGDKLAEESKLISESSYMDILRSFSSNCRHLFVQTDDYICIHNLQKYIDIYHLPIKIYTLSTPEQVGVIVTGEQKTRLENASKTNETNKTYLSDIMQQLQNTKPVDEMDEEEVYDHVITMIAGIEILKHSHYCILDYQSNVSRFIKLFHTRPEHVIDVLQPHQDIDYNKLICPSYSF